MATRPSLFGSSSVTTRCPLCPQVPRGDDLSPALFFLFSQGFPLPPSCPLKRVGSDHLDVWALPRGQGGSEGGSCFLPPPFPQAHCAAFVPRLRLASSFPSCFCVLPPTPHRPYMPLPHTSPKKQNVSSGYGANPCESSMSLCRPSVPSTRASQRPHLVARPRPVANFSSTIGLLPPPGVLPLSTRGASSNWGGSQTSPPLWEGRGAPSALH